MGIVNVTNRNINESGEISFDAVSSSSVKKPITQEAWDAATSVYISSDKLKSLIPLSSVLQNLSLAGCSKIETINNLPPTIQFIDFTGCKKLKNLPNLLECKDLTMINLTGCDQLMSEEFMRQLKDLQDRGCQVVYPKDKEKIQKAEDDVGKINEKNLVFTKTLLSRYLTEKLDKRESQVHLAGNVLEFLNLLKPEHHIWVENLAFMFVKEGCVNQPVAGFFEVVSWLHIASKTDDAEKLKALDPLFANAAVMVFSRSEEFVKKYGIIGKDVEVEFVNVLLGKVHEELFVEGKIDHAWFGLSKKVANEGTVASMFKDNPGLVKDACQYVLKTLQEPSLKNKFEFLINNVEGSLDVWGQIVFPLEIKEIKDAHNSRRSSIINAADRGASEDEIKTKDTDLKVREGNEIAKMIRDRTDEMIDRVVPKDPSASTAKQLGNSVVEKDLRL